jgi:DNA repair exonuclease SbcCD ATPase subunit
MDDRYKKSYSYGGYVICSKHNEISRLSIHIEDQLDQIEKKIVELDGIDHDYYVMPIIQEFLGAIRGHADDIYYITIAAKEDGQNMEDALKSRNSKIEYLYDEIEKLKAEIEELEEVAVDLNDETEKLEAKIKELEEQTNEKQD